jgi:hypothetical protein
MPCSVNFSQTTFFRVYLYANDGLSTQRTLEEIVKILFIKIFDETNRTGLFHLSADEWANLKQAKQVWPFIERVAQLFDITKQAYGDVFDDDDKIRLSPISLGFAINKLR